MIVEADFQRFYGLDPLDLGWGRFSRLLRGLPPESALVQALGREAEEKWSAADDRNARIAFALEHGDVED